MLSLEVSGILYECDGSTITASANGRTFGPGLVSNARVLENGMVYLVIGELHVVLTSLAFDILRGVAVAPQEEPVGEAAAEAAEAVAEEVGAVAVPAPTNTPKRRR
jgi:hypothetical protein